MFLLRTFHHVGQRTGLVPITRYSDAQNLTIQARIELFMRVSEAVQRAHQKGIIHRDLKPSNVLMTEGERHVLPLLTIMTVAWRAGR